MDKGSESYKKSIPKFSSFRPKTAIPPSDQQDDVQQDSPSGKEISSKPEETGHIHGLRVYGDTPAQGHGKRTRYSRDEEDRDYKDLRRESLVAKDSNKHENFVIDRVGDLKNLEFGGLDKYSVPFYHRSGAGEVIGVASGNRIDRRLSSEKNVVITPPNSAREVGKGPLRSFGAQRLRERRLRKDYDVQQLDHGEDYLSLFRIRDHNQSDISATHSSLMFDLDTVRHTGDDGSDVESSQESLSGDEKISSWDTEKENVSGRYREVNKAVESDPKNGSAWLDLIDYQKTNLGSRPTRAERQSVADVRLSMYQKALDTVEDSRMRQKLALGLVREASQLLEGERLSLEWEKMLKAFPTSMEIWSGFLSFRQSDFLLFNLENFKAETQDRMQSLLGRSLQDDEHGKDTNVAFQSQLFILLRTTLCLKEAGFGELATAIWQAMLEFEFFAPAKYQPLGLVTNESSFPEKLTAFRQFWDSEVPRVGEDSSQGWLAYSPEDSQIRDPKNWGVPILQKEEDLFSAWWRAEELSAASSGLPARTIDDLPENDPFRVILFADIEPFLFTVPDPTYQMSLIETFLRFCGLPSYRIGSHLRQWPRSGFLQSQALDGGSATNSQNDSKSMKSTESPILNLTVQEYQTDAATFFSKRALWFSAFKGFGNGETNAIDLSDKIWYLRALKMISFNHREDDQLAEYVLAFESHFSLESAKKSARRFLKHRPSSLRLYNAYASVEYGLGNKLKGDHTIITALGMAANSGKTARPDAILLWRTWIWESLDEGRIAEASSRIQSYGNQSVEVISIPETSGDVALPNPSKILRSETALLALRDHMLTQKSYTHAYLTMECLILLSYLTKDRDFHSALQTFETNTKLLSQRGDASTVSQELLHQSISRLMYHHTTHTHAFKPSDNRSLLAKSITQFPHNTIFLSLYAWNESRFRIHDRLRSVLDTVVLSPSSLSLSSADTDIEDESIITHYFAIQTEMHRSAQSQDGTGSSSSNSNAHTIRAALERALQSRVGEHCPGLWKTYFHFEHGRGDLKRAKAVFHRAVKACPWVKELYLLPFKYLHRDSRGRGQKEGMSDAEVKGVYDSMVARELRVHVDLEEWMDEKGVR